MDKVLMKKRRLRIAAAFTICLIAIVAIPAVASAVTWGGQYPAPDSYRTRTSIVGVDVVSTDASSAAMTIDGAAVDANMVSHSVAGRWVIDSETLVNGVYKVMWRWETAAGDSLATIYAYPPALSAGASHTVVVSALDSTGGVIATTSWSFKVKASAATTDPRTPAGVIGSASECTTSTCHGNTNYNNDPAMGSNCQSCHQGSMAPIHAAQFGTGMQVSGHNTQYGGTTIGGKTKWDGSQGVTLTWRALEAFTVSSIKNAASVTTPGASFTLDQTGIVSSTWDRPTKSVFWQVGDAGAPADAQFLNWDSVVECKDCHSQVTAAGPHGAADNWALDPDYPGDYSKALLTKRVTSGSSVGGGEYAPSGIQMMPSLSAAGFADVAGRTDGTSGSHAVICAKCHKLMTVVPAGSGPGTSGKSYDIAVGANTPHNGHHQDATDGSPQCVNCHVGIPHGWKAPRLLVDTEKDTAPYFDPKALGRIVSGAATRSGLHSLSAMNNHPLVPADGTLAYSSGNGGAAGAPDTSLGGTVLWDESQCDACTNEHEGNEMDNTYGANNGDGVPVRIER